MNHETELLMELRSRAIRTESRLVQLGNFLGASLAEKTPITITPFQGHVHIAIEALDISVSRIYTELLGQGVTIPEDGAQVYLHGVHVFTVNPVPLTHKLLDTHE